MKKTILLLVLLITNRSFAQTVIFDHADGLCDYTYGKSIIQFSDSGYVILGNIRQDIGNTAMILIRTDKLGYPVYYKIHNDYVLYDARFLRQASNGDFLITGSMVDENGIYQPFWMRTDTMFERIWYEHLPCNGCIFEYSIPELPDENIVIVEETYDTDSTGNLVGYTYYDPAHLPKDGNYISIAIGLYGTIVAGAVTSRLDSRLSAIFHGTSQDHSQMLYSNGRFSDNGETYLSQIIPASDNGLVFVGSATTLGTHLTGIPVCKIGSSLNSPNPYIQALGIRNYFEPESSVTLYPNPVDNVAYLQSFSSINNIAVISVYNPEMNFEHNFANSPSMEIFSFSIHKRV